MESIPLLTTQDRQARLAYARANVTRDRKNVIFSDEKLFYATSNSGRICGREGPGEMLINKRLDCVAYTEILSNNFLTSSTDLRVSSKVSFAQNEIINIKREKLPSFLANELELFT